jgi:hypothetical protein
MFSPSQELSVILKKDGFVESFFTPYRGGESYTEFLVPERGYYFVEVIFHKRIDEKFSFFIDIFLKSLQSYSFAVWNTVSISL